MQRIGGDQDILQVGQGGQGRGEGSELIAAGDSGLGEHEPVAVVVDGHQLGPGPGPGPVPGLGPGFGLVAGTAESLAVHGQYLPSGRGRFAVAGALAGQSSSAGQHPAGEHLLQRVGVDRAQHAAERGCVRRRPANVTAWSAWAAQSAIAA